MSTCSVLFQAKKKLTDSDDTVHCHTNRGMQIAGAQMAVNSSFFTTMIGSVKKGEFTAKVICIPPILDVLSFFNFSILFYSSPRKDAL